jgi:hypothetical protein
MKRFKLLAIAALLVGLGSVASVSLAGDKESKIKPYPLDTCLVSGEKLGEMGKPYVYEYKDREIKFCCKNCVKDFNKDTAKYIKKLEEAEAKAKK